MLQRRLRPQTDEVRIGRPHCNPAASARTHPGKPGSPLTLAGEGRRQWPAQQREAVRDFPPLPLRELRERGGGWDGSVAELKLRSPKENSTHLFRSCPHQTTSLVPSRNYLTIGYTL